MKILLDSDHTLEFDKVLEFISLKCVSELGKIRLKNSQPIDDELLLKNTLKEVSEAKEVYISEGGIPVWSFDDIRLLLNKIEPLDSYLDIADCQKVQNFLEVSESVSNFFEKKEELSEEIKKYADKIDPLSNILNLIKNTIDPSGTIYDNASPDLKKVRAQIGVVSKQIHTKLERIIRKQTEHIQDDFITLRDGRLVIPVREYSVNKIPGIVHGQSATGQTHYVEPMPVVPLNNEIFELYNQEKREVIRILKRLSANFRDNKEALLINQENLVHIDTVQARAQYSIVIDGRAPIINDSFTWNIQNGYHPLLLKKIGKDAIPLSLKIGNDFRIVVITGPNAGGKTVALKTLGLLQLLFQCGFHIPVAEGSKFPVCHQMAAVIGDEQSIEDDLSTFSSHIKKLNEIIEQLTHRSLVLIDEIGTGTDPAEGSALAISFLEEFNRDGIITLVTTHLSELKAFAHKLDQAVNAMRQCNLILNRFLRFLN
jgi:DNA mismatch repair protein MutS2